jgi:predicted permease
MRFARDLKFAARQLRLAPGYAAAAIVTLALAIGAATAIFSAVYSVLLKPMPIREPQQLVVGWGTSDRLNMKVIELSYLDIDDIGRAAPEVGPVASHGASPWTDVLDGDGGGEPVKVASVGVSGTFFEVLGAAPTLGRVIVPDDDRTTSARVIVLSHGLWSTRFGADPGIIGSSIRFDDQPHEVIGVMPASFDYPRGTEAWKAVAPILGAVPARPGAVPPMRGIGVLVMIGRLNPGIAVDAAQDAWTRANARVQAAAPSSAPKYDIAVTPFLDHHVGPARQAMWVLLGAVGVLLMIACANVSGLMLTRVSLRSRDDAVRVALGGTQSAIARVWLAETVWLTVIGGALGLLMCQWLIGSIIALAPEGIPRMDQVAIDWNVAGFSVLAMALVTLLCAAAPLRHAGVVNLAESLSDGSRTVAGGRSDRTRSSLLVVQIGLAVVLLIAAGLVVQSFSALRRLDFGFSREAVLRLKVEPRSTAVPASAWISDLLVQVRQLPDVATAGAVYLTPMELGSIGQGTWALAEGQPETPEQASRNPIVNYQSATPEYFTAMGIPLRRGRLFSDEDRATSPRVSLISESTAAAYFPGQDPIGKRIKAASFNGNPALGGEWRTIVGVVGNVRYKGLHEVQLDLYDPPAQNNLPVTSIVVRMKTGRERQALAVAAAIQTQARQLDPRVLVSGIQMIGDVVDKAIAPWRFSAWVFAVFAALAFMLAMLGLFSLVSLDVANRRREFAIRMAMGATGGDIVGGVFRSAGRRAGIGIAAGVIVAVMATRTLQSLLYGVTVIDVKTYAAVVAMVVAVVACASYIPARRAALANPLALLRRD